jgi:transposase
MWLRNRFVNANNVPKHLKYLLDCPKDIRANVLKDLANALSINFEKRKDKPEFKFSMKFRSKKEIQSIKFDDYAAYIHDWTVSKNSEKQKGNRVQFTMFRTKLKDPLWFYVRNRDIKNNKVLEKPIRECTLVRDKLGRFYLHVPIYLEHKKEEHLDQEWCAIDPGVRSLMTIYSPNKEKCFKLANSDIGRIYRLCLSVDKLVSKGAKSKGKVKRAIKKHELNLRKRIKNLADEVHWKIINFLTNNFTHIIYPTYNIGNMIKKSERSISNKSVRQMISWRNFTLKQRLIERCKEKGVQLIQCTEEYTSKTCTNCGHIDKNLKDKKIYSCKQCNLVIDRDLNAARNIFIKNVYSKIQPQVVSKEI